MAARPDRAHILGIAAFAAGIAILPFLLPNDYYLTVLIVAGFNAILTLGLNLLMGYAGQISLGHAAFYGIAAYTTGVLTATWRWPVPAGIAAGIAVVVLVAAAIAVPTLRLKGHYLAMGTLGFGLIVYIVLNEATALTGGPSGLTGIPKLAVLGTVVSS
ncbi:MAG TPA: branched-chain amino acid ABC transporter permease, partial [Candidatus Methylomirabilis sp.]